MARKSAKKRWESALDYSDRDLLGKDVAALLAAHPAERVLRRRSERPAATLPSSCPSESQTEATAEQKPRPIPAAKAKSTPLEQLRYSEQDYFAREVDALIAASAFDERALRRREPPTAATPPSPPRRKRAKVELAWQEGSDDRSDGLPSHTAPCGTVSRQSDDDVMSVSATSLAPSPKCAAPRKHVGGPLTAPAMSTAVSLPPTASTSTGIAADPDLPAVQAAGETTLIDAELVFNNKDKLTNEVNRLIAEHPGERTLRKRVFVAPAPQRTAPPGQSTSTERDKTPPRSSSAHPSVVFDSTASIAVDRKRPPARARPPSKRAREALEIDFDLLPQDDRKSIKGKSARKSGSNRRADVDADSLFDLIPPPLPPQVDRGAAQLSIGRSTWVDPTRLSLLRTPAGPRAPIWSETRQEICACLVDLPPTL
jgi:hypothetical protein